MSVIKAKIIGVLNYIEIECKHLVLYKKLGGITDEQV